MLSHQETVRFGLYTADLHASELKRGQDTVPLQNLPFRLLAVLLREPGRVVTRDELSRELWPANTFVDFERGISTAVNKLREALGDSASNPRYIETVGRRGYRFIAPVSEMPSPQAAPTLPLSSAQAAPAPAPAPEVPAVASGRAGKVGVFKRAAFFSLAILVIASVVLAFDWMAHSPVPRVIKIAQLTNSGLAEPAAGLHTDGSRLYFIERSGPKWSLMQTSIAGGEVVAVSVPFPNTILLAISPDRSEILITTRAAYRDKHALWILPIQGGTPQRVGD